MEQGLGDVSQYPLEKNMMKRDEGMGTSNLVLYTPNVGTNACIYDIL